jgi:hypothetical protein
MHLDIRNVMTALAAGYHYRDGVSHRVYPARATTASPIFHLEAQTMQVCVPRVS